MKLKDKQVVFNRKLEFKNSLLDVDSNCFSHFLILIADRGLYKKTMQLRR